MSEESLVIWTIGHSTHAWAKFVELLRGAQIDLLADVRRFPSSRRQPQFNGPTMHAALAQAGIEYRHFEDLGGHREQRLPDSPNTAWEAEAFNAYADHTQSREFRASVAELLELAAARRTAIMCAEAVPWQCHRRVLSDALIATGVEVRDIFPSGEVRSHALTEFAKVKDGEVTYPGGWLF